VAAGVSLLSVVAWATSAIPMSVSERTRFSDRVVLAQVLSTQTVVKEGDARTMRTLTRVVVGEDWKGQGPAQLEVQQLGGRWGLWEAHIPGDAQFTRGQTVVLWLRCAQSASCQLVRLGEGKALVEGGEVVLFDLSTGEQSRQSVAQLKASVSAPPPGVPDVKRGPTGVKR
jgi:hypothetical protein